MNLTDYYLLKKGDELITPVDDYEFIDFYDDKTGFILRSKTTGETDRYHPDKIIPIVIDVKKQQLIDLASGKYELKSRDDVKSFKGIPELNREELGTKQQDLIDYIIQFQESALTYILGKKFNLDFNSVEVQKRILLFKYKTAFKRYYVIDSKTPTESFLFKFWMEIDVISGQGYMMKFETPEGIDAVDMLKYIEENEKK